MEKIHNGEIGREVDMTASLVPKNQQKNAGKVANDIIDVERSSHSHMDQNIRIKLSII